MKQDQESRTFLESVYLKFEVSLVLGFRSGQPDSSAREVTRGRQTRALGSARRSRPQPENLMGLEELRARPRH